MSLSCSCIDIVHDHHEHDNVCNAQALSKKAGVEFSIADISGDDLMSQREALATQGVKVRGIYLLITRTIIRDIYIFPFNAQSKPS